MPATASRFATRPRFYVLAAVVMEACSSENGSVPDATTGGEPAGSTGGSGATPFGTGGWTASSGASGGIFGVSGSTGGGSLGGGIGSGAVPGSGGGLPSGGQQGVGASASGGISTGGLSGTGGPATGGAANTGGMATGGVTHTGGSPSAGGVTPTGGLPNTGGADETGGAATGGAATGAPAGGTHTGGSGACDVSDPPSSVAAWVEESWNSEASSNIESRSAWLLDSAILGGGEINLCIRWGATRSVSPTTRDKIAPAMQRWFNEWFSLIYGYDCFPYAGVTVKITGWAVKPGQESLLEWSDRTVPVYTETESGSDPPNEPKCPDECGFFFNWDHEFPDCAAGEEGHFDYSVWLDDRLPGSGAAAVGGDWGIRIPVADFLGGLDQDSNSVVLHEMGHGFAMQDYYTWNGSRPTGGSIMIVGTTETLTVGDQWLARRLWRETKALRYDE